MNMKIVEITEKLYKQEINPNEAERLLLDLFAVSGSSLDKDLVEQRCKSVLEYLFPNYERQMTAKQHNNAMEALRSIAFGPPAGKNYR